MAIIAATIGFGLGMALALFFAARMRDEQIESLNRDINDAMETIHEQKRQIKNVNNLLEESASRIEALECEGECLSTSLDKYRDMRSKIADVIADLN